MVGRAEAAPLPPTSESVTRSAVASSGAAREGVLARRRRSRSMKAAVDDASRRAWFRDVEPPWRCWCLWMLSLPAIATLPGHGGQAHKELTRFFKGVSRHTLSFLFWFSRSERLV